MKMGQMRCTYRRSSDVTRVETTARGLAGGIQTSLRDGMLNTALEGKYQGITDGGADEVGSERETTILSDGDGDVDCSRSTDEHEDGKELHDCR